MNDVGAAFLLTTLAGLCTGIGSLVAFFCKRTNKTFLCLSLGFSAGVMMYVSFVDLFQHARARLQAAYGTDDGMLLTVAAFLGGMLLIAALDRLVPEQANPHEVRDGDSCLLPEQTSRMARTGIMTAIAIAIHNFPEGLATFTATLAEPSIGVSIAIAVAIHNIPEGISVSVPVFFATGSRKKAFWLSFLSGLSEPLGALVGYLALLPFMAHSQLILGFLFAAVAGIMVFVSLDELLPAAREYDRGHQSIYGLMIGMAVMAVSLWMSG